MGGDMFTVKRIRMTILCAGVVVCTFASPWFVRGQDESLAGAEAAQRQEAAAAERADGRRFTTWPEDAEPIERWLYEMLDQPVDLSYPGPQVPLKSVLADIENQISEAHGTTVDGHVFRMVFWPDYAELGLDLKPDDPLEEVTINRIEVRGKKLRSALNLIFQQVIDPIELTYVIQDEVMLVTSPGKADSSEMTFTRVYDVGDLLDVKNRTEADHGAEDHAAGRSAKQRMADRSESDTRSESNTIGIAVHQGSDSSGIGREPILTQFSGTPAGLANVSSHHATLLEKTVVSMTAGNVSWIQTGNEFGEISVFGRSLVVRQTCEGHQQIVRLLNQLSESMQRQR
jgi:hypothetical protein